MGRMQWERTGNFQRHCVETKNEEKTTSMLYDYPRTGLARWTSLPQTLLEASERLSNKTLLNWITGSHSSDVSGHTFMIRQKKSRCMGFKLGLYLFSWFLSFSVWASLKQPTIKFPCQQVKFQKPRYKHSEH